ncbi:MAG TPA: Mur ligase family protein [Candidatus Paceibacterota bacterium]
MLEKTLAFLRSFIPAPLFKLGQPTYHYALALLAAIIYRFPARKIRIVMITGTKGKSTTAELVNSILEANNLRTALTSTIRTKVGDTAYPNLYKMTTPGRFFLQKFLRAAVRKNCDWAIIEMTSQAVTQHRHKFINYEALIYTGIHPEHIEAHGSFDNYLKAKLELARARPNIIVANLDDEHSQKFLDYARVKKIGFKLSDAFPYQTELPGEFNKRNVLAAAKFAQAIGISEEVIKKGIAELGQVPGRMEFIGNSLGLTVVVDYAHTTGSLEEVYKTMSQSSPLRQGFAGQAKLICVLGACGGGRDSWKRPEFGKIAEKYCDKIVLTDEDPYDEDPRKIVADIERGISDKSKYEVEMNRRRAIAKALGYAKNGDAVVITGKGTDPYIMGPHGSKQPWSDSQITREELANLSKTE